MSSNASGGATTAGTADKSEADAVQKSAAGAHDTPGITAADKAAVAAAARLKRDQVLRARAKLLARATSVAEAEDFVELLEFQLSGEHYGLELSCLREVCAITEVTGIPCSPPFVRGVINLRGQIIPLIDMLILLNIGDKATQHLSKAIILQREKLAIGLLADEVLGAKKIPTASLQKAFAGFEGQGADYLRGVTKEKLIVMDGRKLLEDPQLNP